jgi:hypothetical protein
MKIIQIMGEKYKKNNTELSALKPGILKMLPSNSISKTQSRSKP